MHNVLRGLLAALNNIRVVVKGAEFKDDEFRKSAYLTSVAVGNLLDAELQKRSSMLDFVALHRSLTARLLRVLPEVDATQLRVRVRVKRKYFRRKASLVCEN